MGTRTTRMKRTNADFIRFSVLCSLFKRICNPLVLVLGFIIRQKIYVDIKRITNPDTKAQRIINPLGRIGYFLAIQRTLPPYVFTLVVTLAFACLISIMYAV